MSRATLTTRIGLGADRAQVVDDGAGTLWEALRQLPGKPQSKRAMLAVGMFAQVMADRRMGREERR